MGESAFGRANMATTPKVLTTVSKKDGEMALSNAMSDSETHSDMPALVGPDEVVRIAEDHKVLAREGSHRGNIVPFPHGNTMGRNRRIARAKRR